MQQPSIAREQPLFTDLATFALRLSQAYTSWRDPQTGEDALSYFQHSARHTGDELGLRATLIRDHILPAFQYEPTQIEFESRERYDMVLYSQNGRRIAIIETKSSSVRNLIAIRRGHETPTEQLERYLSQAGLYLGVLTNGDEWHLFDFAVGREPLASLSLIELARLLQGIDNREAAQMRLYANPSLQQSLAIIFYYLDARRWEQTDVFRANLSNAAYFQVASLQILQQVEALVQHIKQVLSSLRETIHTQFALLRQRYAEYLQLCTHISSTDPRPFDEALQDAIEKVGQFGTAFHMYDDGQLKMEIFTLLQGLSAQYLTDGDIAAFESDYLQQAQEILTKYQLSQTSLVEKKSTRSVRLLPSMNGLDQVKMLLQVHYVYLQALAEDYDLSIKANQAYLAWKTSVRGIFRAPEDEFCLQTAYIHFVRLFFVRVCEDHALTSRRISDGPFTTYEHYRHDLLEGVKDTYQRLLTEAYQRASSVYHNFFGQHEFFDWYVLDEYTILALFDLLNRYNFHGLSADVLGRVYNEGYIEAKERSERGQFYTPPQVVDYMLDALGIPTGDETDERKARQFLDKKVGDLSCGSGTFLVAAAARKSKLLQRLVATNQITAQYALEQLTETFLGFDLNPFACYLAEINLLIQCLPFLVDEQGRLCRSINRFHIYCTDALEPTVAEQVNAQVNGTATEDWTLLQHQRGRFISDDERTIVTIKDAKALPSDLLLTTQQQGLDYLVGNPPYVSAGESEENLLYRSAIRNFGVYHFLHQRWDLFVPFLERNLQFLRPRTGRMGLIVSKGIETEGYAERLRQHLSTQHHILQLDFFPGSRLFQDAAIENTIVTLEHRLPEEGDEVIRRRHLQVDCQHFETLPPVTQLDANGQLFRWRYDHALDQNIAQGSVLLCAIAYIGTGVEAQSKETFDPFVLNRREKLFKLDNVFLPPEIAHTRTVEYVDEGVLGNDVDRYYLRRTRYVAYEKYRPQMRRPRHIALFRTPEKLLLGETSGGYYDRAHLFANHSVQVVVPWTALEDTGAIEEKGIKTVLRESRQIVGINDSFAPVAQLFDLRYLLGIINSQFIRRFLASNRLEGTREGRIYPDVWKRLPIKIASTQRQQEVADLVDEIQAQYRQLLALPTPMALEKEAMHQFRSIQGYLARGDIRLVGEPHSTITERPVVKEEHLILRRQPLTYLEAPDAPELLRYLTLYLSQLHPELQKLSWMDARQRIQVPPTLEAVREFMRAIKAVESQKQQMRAAIQALLAQIEDLVEAIYYEPADSDRSEVIRKLREKNKGAELF